MSATFDGYTYSLDYKGELLLKDGRIANVEITSEGVNDEFCIYLTNLDLPMIYVRIDNVSIAVDANNGPVAIRQFKGYNVNDELRELSELAKQIHIDRLDDEENSEPDSELANHEIANLELAKHQFESLISKVKRIFDHLIECFNAIESAYMPTKRAI